MFTYVEKPGIALGKRIIGRPIEPFKLDSFFQDALLEKTPPV